jgi:hypothetical protein
LLKFSDGRNFGRTLVGLCLIVAPALFLIASVVGPDADDENKTKELAQVAAHKSAYIISGIIFLVGSLLLLGACVGIIHVFRGRRVGLGQVAGGLLLVGSAVTFAFYGFTSIEYEMVNQSGLDRAQMAKLLDKTNDAASGAPLFLMFIVGVVLGLILLGVAAWRRRIVPRWAAVVIAISGPVTFFSEGKTVEIIAFAILLVGFVPLGLALLRMSDEEWDAPRAAVHKPPMESDPVPAAPAPATAA